ncbi:MAG: hypothetical protein A4E66_00627 [Syntrophus sp. PtaB.Bin001]|nr:MAG: hypothetical protein A4E66_00627 [Syntrophus sp. PtaB.Bin001]
MKKFKVEVERVNGYCAHGYKTGDMFVFNGMDTPDAFCGGAYTTLFPIIFALGSGARFDFEKVIDARRAWPVRTTVTLFSKLKYWMPSYSASVI